MVSSNAPLPWEVRIEFSGGPTRPDYELLESFVEAVSDPCLLIDSAGCVLAVSRAWKELPRRDEAANLASNPIGADYLELFRSSTADKGLERVLTGIKAVLSGQQDQFEHEYIRPIPHTIRWFRMTVRAWRQLGVGALISHRDITPEPMGLGVSQSTDQEFRSLADSAPVMIWMTGPDHGCTFVNRKWLEFTGAQVEEALGILEWMTRALGRSSSLVPMPASLLVPRT